MVLNTFYVEMSSFEWNEFLSNFQAVDFSVSEYIGVMYDYGIWPSCCMNQDEAMFYLSEVTRSSFGDPISGEISAKNDMTCHVVQEDSSIKYKFISTWKENWFFTVGSGTYRVNTDDFDSCVVASTLNVRVILRICSWKSNKRHVLSLNNYTPSWFFLVPCLK